MNKTSRLAMMAAAGLMMGSWTSSARAADLGGDCCADLEERVAELEATTVRKGNRKVSLELSGQVNKALMAWDDGKSSDVYVVDNNYSSTRLRFKGTGEMTPGWKAGFYMEYEFRDSSSNLVDQTNQVNRGIENALRIRQENVFIESERFGRVTLGQQNGASKDIELIDLGGDILDPENYYSNNFFVRDNTQAVVKGQNGNIGFAALTRWGTLANTFDPGRQQLIRYDTPSIYGFVASAAWGQNDYFDVALRYQKEWNSIRVAAGVGYYYSGDPYVSAANFASEQLLEPGNNQPCGFPATVGGCLQSKIEAIQGSASILHIPTGLWLTGGAGSRHLINPGYLNIGALSNQDATWYDIKGGITKRWWDVGATTIFGDYSNYDNQGIGAAYSSALIGTTAPTTSTTVPFAFPTVSAIGRITQSNVDRWAVGVTQAFDNAALELYANYVHWSADITYSLNTTATVTTKASPQDFDAVITGARIKF